MGEWELPLSIPFIRVAHFLMDRFARNNRTKKVGKVLLNASPLAYVQKEGERTTPNVNWAGPHNF